MDKLYAIRDAFFWWVGVWATVTVANHRVFRTLREREYARYREEFVAEMESWRDDEPEETETAPEKPEADNAPET